MSGANRAGQAEQDRQQNSFLGVIGFHWIHAENFCAFQAPVVNQRLVFENRHVLMKPVGDERPLNGG